MYSCIKNVLICTFFIVVFANSWSAILASPNDVRGSSNVAVCGYSNSAGNFVLWSSGRITNLSGKEINSSTNYGTAYGSLPSRISGHLLGSSHVAVGVLSTDEATMVVFSDGTVKKPKNSEASAPCSKTRRIVSGCNVTNGQSKSGDDGWKCTIQTTTNPRYMQISFNKSFNKVPIVLYNCDLYAYHTTGSLNALPVECFSRCTSTVSQFRVTTNGGGNSSNSYTQYVPYSLSFVAFEDT